MPTFYFYYDETEHTRVVTANSVMAENYSDGFMASIVGWRFEDQESLLEEYERFEKRFAHRRDKKGELKSTTIKTKNISRGLASLSKEETVLVGQLFDMLDERCFSFFFFASKVEYVVNQLFSGCHRDSLVNYDAMCYCITKAINAYQPSRVIELICSNFGRIDSSVLVAALKVFLAQRIEINLRNKELKQFEIQAYRQAIAFLEDVNCQIDLSWDYRSPFICFNSYLREQGIHKYRLCIDNERKSARAAREYGIKYVSESDSLDSIGVRMADMVGGIIAKLIKALRVAQSYQSDAEATQKKELNCAWFKLDQTRFELYKKLYSVVMERNNAYSKFCAGNYADDVIVFTSFLEYLNGFDSADQLEEQLDTHPSWFDAFACHCLSGHFERTGMDLLPG